MSPVDLEYLRIHKTPSTLDNYVGIEIEFIVKKKSEVEDIQKQLIENKLHYICNLGSDASIKCWDEALKKKLHSKEMKLKEIYDAIHSRHYNTVFYSDFYRDESYKRLYAALNKLERLKNKYKFSGYGKELRILCKESALKNTIFKVMRILNDNNAMVNSSCGLHVHLDMRNRDFEKSVKALFKNKKEIFKSVPKERLESNFCKPNKKISFNSTKYQAINTGSYSNKKTIEVRLHEATLSATEIYNWCKYLIALVDEKELSKILSGYIARRTNVRTKAS